MEEKKTPHTDVNSAVSLHHRPFHHFPLFVDGKVVILWIVQRLLDSLIQVLQGDEVLSLVLLAFKTNSTVRLTGV